MTPLGIRRERAVEVLKLISRLGDYDQRQNPAQGEEVRHEGDKVIIRRKAGDDWF